MGKIEKAIVSKKECLENRKDLPLTFLTARRLDDFQIEVSDSSKRGMETDTWGLHGKHPILSEKVMMGLQ